MTRLSEDLAMMFFTATVLFVFWCMLLVSAIEYRRVRGKGYRAPGASIVLAMTWGLAVAGTMTVAVVTRLDKSAWWHFLGIWLAFHHAIAWMAVLLLPRRSGRVFDRRRNHIPFLVLGWICLALCIAFPVSAIYVWLARRPLMWVDLRIVPATIMSYLAGSQLIGRSRLPSYEGVVPLDPRPPVLYLRAFGQENLPFVQGDTARYGTWVKGLAARLA